MEDEKVPLSRTENLHEIEIPVVSESIDVLHVPQKLPCSSICAFSKKESSSMDSKQRSKSATKLGVLIIVYLLFMVVEIVGGVKSNSLAVLTDAAHMLTDVSGFATALFAVIASGWEATSDQSFGYHRLEVLSALLSLQLIWVFAVILIYEAVDRMLHEHAKVNGVLMFAVAAFGFLVNFIMVMWLGHDHTHHHQQQQQQHHHTCGDLDYHDDHGHNHDHDHGKEEACTITEDDETSLVSSAQRTPREIDINKLEKGLKSIKGVQDVHDLHVWSLTVGKMVLSCHVTADPTVGSSQIIDEIRDFCERTYRIHEKVCQNVANVTPLHQQAFLTPFRYIYSHMDGK
ncbi:hypothetical protein ACLB2K_031132 [Fragaria x ananassa]